MQVERLSPSFDVPLSFRGCLTIESQQFVEGSVPLTNGRSERLLTLMVRRLAPSD